MWHVTMFYDFVKKDMVYYKNKADNNTQHQRDFSLYVPDASPICKYADYFHFISQQRQEGNIYYNDFQCLCKVCIIIILAHERFTRQGPIPRYDQCLQPFWDPYMTVLCILQHQGMVSTLLCGYSKVINISQMFSLFYSFVEFL